MESVAMMKSGSLAAQGFSLSLMSDFVAYIDRSAQTTRTHLTNLRQFGAWLLFTGIRNPIRRDILQYRDWLSTEHNAITLDTESPKGWRYRCSPGGVPIMLTCKPSTIRGYLQSVKQFFSWTAAAGYYPNVAENVHAPKVTAEHKKDGLTPQEVLTVEHSIESHAQEAAALAAVSDKDRAGRIQRIDEQGKRLYAMYLLAVNAGLRTVEISRANVRDIETKGNSAWLYIWGKGHSAPDQRKPLAPEVKAAIDDYLKARELPSTGNSPLFVSTGNRSGGKRIAPTTISTMLKRALQSAGFDSDRITAHSLRHSTAQAVMNLTGNNIYQTQQYLRHSSPKTTEIYLENDNTAQDEAIARRLYQYYHREGPAEQNRLEGIIQDMTPAQLAQLTAIAATLQGK